MTAVSERLAALVAKSDVSLRELSRRMGLKNHVSLSKWIKGEYEPSEEGLQAICKYFGVSPAYIKYGEGDGTPVSRVADDGYIEIPLLSVHVSCGTDIEEPGPLPVSTLKKIRVDPERISRLAPGADIESLHMLPVEGDSMSPTLEDGDTIIVDTSDTRIRADGVYAVQLNGNTLAKRIQILPNGIRILSDNPRYPPIEVGEQDYIKVIGRVYLFAFLRAAA